MSDTEEKRARVALLRQQRIEADDAFATAVERKDFGAMIAASERGGRIDVELLSLVNPVGWQARELREMWTDEEKLSFVSWMSGYNPDALLRFELSRRDLPANTRKEES